MNEKLILESVESFINSVNCDNLKQVILKAMSQTVQSGDFTPNDTRDLHYLYALIQDLSDLK